MNASIQSSLRVMYDNLGPAEFYEELREALCAIALDRIVEGGKMDPEITEHAKVWVAAERARNYFRGGGAAGKGEK